jgi:peptide/nickel transport system permease protein
MGTLRIAFRTRLAAPAFWLLVVVVLGAVFADFLSPYTAVEQDYTVFLTPPSRAHPMGTDELGRDVLSRLIYGSRISLEVGVIAVGVATILGVTWGLAAGYGGGRMDNILMRVIDGIQAFPSLILALAIAAALGPSITNVMIAVGLVGTPTFARLTRAQVLSIKEREYVLAAQVGGASHLRIVLQHIWPNSTSPIIVQATLQIAAAIITEAGLSFLGVGATPPTPSWGGMLRSGYQYLSVAPWLSIFPGLAIFLVVLSFNFLGDGLRVALDPHLARRDGG